MIGKVILGSVVGAASEPPCLPCFGNSMADRVLDGKGWVGVTEA